MPRVFAVALALGLVLLVGQTEARTLTEHGYSASVHGSLDVEQVMSLVEALAEFEWRPCRTRTSRCPDDLHTDPGDWVPAERRLRREFDQVADSITSLKTPFDLGAAQTDLVAGLRGCSDNLRELETDVPRIYNLDVIDEFSRKVSRVVHDCLDELSDITLAFTYRYYRLDWY